MGCGGSKSPIEIDISISDSSSDCEPLQPLKLYEPKKITEKKEMVYDKKNDQGYFSQGTFKNKYEIF